MSKSHFNKTSMSKFGKDTTETAWKTTLSPQEVVTQRNLFQDYKVEEIASARSGTSHNKMRGSYDQLKNDRVNEFTKKGA